MEGVKDADLCRAAMEMSRGLVDADLGGGLLKKRIGRSGQGKRGGFRTLVANRDADDWFFIYGYAKCDMDNISQSDQRECRLAARRLLSLDERAREDQLAMGELHELNCHA